MKRQTIIRLECKVREDGAIHVQSPDLPLFHAVGHDAGDTQRAAIEILEEYLQRNYGVKVEITPAESLESFLARREDVPSIAAHVIAEMAA